MGQQERIELEAADKEIDRYYKYTTALEALNATQVEVVSRQAAEIIRLNEYLADLYQAAELVVNTWGIEGAIIRLQEVVMQRGEH